MPGGRRLEETKLARITFAEDGDPYIEDDETIWLLHWPSPPHACVSRHLGKEGCLTRTVHNARYVCQYLVRKTCWDSRSSLRLDHAAFGGIAQFIGIDLELGWGDA